MAIDVEDDHLLRIGWKYPVFSGAAHECGGTRPLPLRLSRTGALRGISRWRGVFAHRVVQGTFAHLGQVLETLGLIP